MSVPAGEASGPKGDSEDEEGPEVVEVVVAVVDEAVAADVDAAKTTHKQHVTLQHLFIVQPKTAHTCQQIANSMARDRWASSLDTAHAQSDREHCSRGCCELCKRKQLELAIAKPN